ncbi:MAG: hypothetical protein JW810_11935, partial [Sedimentisphaerales bacterium]|nr:hypothetical protein [Sedimentisphaerales bacterium]
QVKLTKIEFAIPDGGTVADTQLELQASIKLPDDMGGFELSIADPHKLIVSPTAGVSLSGGKLTLPDLEIFMFGGELKMIAKDMSVEYIAEVAGANAQPAALRFRGSVSLPYFYNATADFTGDDSYIEVTRLGGVDWYGTLSVEDIVIVPGQWEINNALLGMKKDDQGNYITECEAKMTFPTGIALGGKIHFINGDINFVELEADNINKPLGATGAFLQRIMGHVDHLSEFEQPPQPVSFGGSVGITAGPQITVDLPDWVGLGDKVEGVLVGLDLSADADENHLNGHGYLEIVSGLIQGNANVDVNWTHGSFNASADLNALQGLITAGASLFIDYSEAFGTTDIFAAGKGAVKIPSVIPLWGGVELGSANMKLQYRDDNTDNNDYLMGWGKILVSEYHNYYLTGGIKVGFDGSYQFVGGKEIIQFTAPDTKAQAKAILSLPAPQTPPGKAAYSADYLVEPNTPWLLMGADWENAEDNVTVEVTDPQGNVYAEDDLDSLDHIMIVDVMSDSYGKTVYVHEPEAGTWSVRFISSGDLTGMAISGVIQATPPAIEITGVDPDPASRKVTIEYTADWSDDDTVINLYYDTDAENADGLQLAGDIAPTTGGTQVWDTSDVPPGTYYMYAEIIDSTNAPVTVYWPTPIDIEEAPTSVEVDLGDGLAKSVVYTDADGTAVTVKLAKGQGTLSFTGENIVTTGSAKGIEVTGDALVLAGVNLTSSTDMTSLTVTTKAGNVEGTTIGPITGDSLGKLTGKQLDIIGDITLTGFLGSMAVDDVGPNVTVTANASAKGFALKANDIADNVEFDLTGTVKGIQAATYASGTIRADQIGQVKIAEGAFGAAVQAQIGDIMGISTAGDITGSITAGGAIKKIAAKSGSLVGAVVRAGTQLASLAAVNLDNAIISAGDDIQKINLAGDILGSHILGGYDIGADCLFGGGDSLSGGNVLSVTAKGTFAGSYIAAGILPNSPLTTFLPDVGEDSVEGGTIGKIKFAAIDYLNGGTAFGLYAATEIKPFKVGTELAQSQDDFVIG